MEFYTQGKGAGYDLDGALRELTEACRGREEVLRMFLEIQMRAAILGDGLQGAARAALLRVAGVLGIGALEFAHLEILARLQSQAAGFRPGGAGGPRAQAPGRDALADAYEVLEVPANASDAEVKRSYRRLMSRNHPDKLVARGLPESMLEVAKQKTQAIQAAYERVREARGMR
jgi:DnaJ like chaperone protein